MRAKLLHEDDGLRTFILAFDKDDEVIDTLTAFAKSEEVTGSSFTAIGAFRHATLGYFNPERNDYDRSDVDEQCEVVSLIGDVAVHDGEPTVHAHVVLGKSDFTTLGGHLFAGTVWPTLELVLTESPEHLRKRRDPETGLTLLSP